MKRVGIVTIHSTYNIGSVLQAQATQKVIQNLGYDAEIIDYRPASYDKYDLIYCRRASGGSIKGFVFYFLLNMRYFQRQKRINSFIDYQRRNLRLSSSRYKSCNEMKEIANKYDIFVSGSDQIWSKNVPEIASEEDIIMGYFLNFTNNKKISYASCVASMQESDLWEYKKYLKEYSALSTREQIGVEKLQKVTGKKVKLVLDPTLLIDSNEWMKYASAKICIDEPYVLLYSLKSHTAEKNWSKALNKFSKVHNLKIVVIAPYFEYKLKNSIDMRLVGPSEFISLYSKASVICTDTFHGTAFAVNFNKPFFSLGNKYWKDDIRKTSLLKLLNLENRLIDDESDILKYDDYSCNYDNANHILEMQRSNSITYLKKALSN